jgi:hypothetical protein
MQLNRRGIAVAEAVVAVTLAALLIGTALGTLSTLQRALARQVARTTREQTLRAAVQLAVAELRDVAPVAGDIVALASTGVTYRATRASGVACGRDPDGILVASDTYRPLRTPVANRDSLTLMLSAGAWIRVPLDGPPRAGTCPDGTAAVILPSVPGLPDPIASVTWPAPLRVFEIMELRAYQSGSEWWLGQRSVSSGETIQPALGPLASGGLSLLGLDSLAQPTAAPLAIRQLRLTIRLASGDSLVRSLSLSPAGVP